MAAAQRLSVTMREGVRAIADAEAGIRPLGDSGLTKVTCAALKRRGLVRFEDGKGWSLTARGREMHTAIMASGDGPEQLKEMLRFG